MITVQWWVIPLISLISSATGTLATLFIKDFLGQSVSKHAKEAYEDGWKHCADYMLKRERDSRER